MGDIAINLTLTFHHRQMLILIAKRGGRLPYSFGRVAIDDPGNKFTDEEKKDLCAKADESVRDMANKLHVITMTAIIGALHPNTYELALTDAGRQVIEQLKLMEPQFFNIDLKTGKEKIGTGKS